MKIAIVGLGYVGIQLAVAFGREHDTTGFDPDKVKLASYISAQDPTGEVLTAQFVDATGLYFTSNPEDLRGCEIYIVAVPTPIDELKNPDLEPLLSASRLVGTAMDRGAIVVFESTVYPGTTEEVCIPVLEATSSLTWQRDFYVGYSPERINPGDPDHTLASITTVVAGDNENTLQVLADLYGSVVEAGIHRAPSIRVAEAAKVIENTQRDLNVALMNELAVIFDRLDIDTSDVLDAAASKWNFLPFRPGLVGGHCIGVDPYYLTYKAQMVDYHPEVILAGRRINDHMGRFVAEKTIRLMEQIGLAIPGTSVNVLGITFKENCPDTRNSQVFPLVRELEDFGLRVAVVDPHADQFSVKERSGVRMTFLEELSPAPVVILAVPHKVFYDEGFVRLNQLIIKPGILIDVKAVFRDYAVLNPQLTYWSL